MQFSVKCKKKKKKKMGNEKSTEKPPTVHEDVIKIINANVQQTAHLQKTADATSILAYVALGCIVFGAAYIIIRAVIKHERLRTTESIKNAVSLTNVLCEK